MNLAINGNQTSAGNSIALNRLIEGIECTVYGDVSGIGISGLTNDSRKVRPGDLFFAVPGFSFDGTKFISEATSLGAVAIVAQSEVNGIAHIPVIKCPNIRQVMSQIAARFYDYPSKSLQVVGITGTNGKTTVTYMLGHIMDTFGLPFGRIGTVEYFSGKRKIQATNTTPDTLEIQKMLGEMRDSGLKGCIMEVSSHGLDQHRCDDIEYNLAVFTNLTRDHLDYHKDFENYFNAKSLLFSQLLKKDGLAILNANDPYAEELKSISRADSITYSAMINDSQARKADIVLIDKGYKDNRRYFELRRGDEKISGYMPYLGKFNLNNAAAALATISGMGLDLKLAAAALENAPQVPGRVEKVIVGQPFEVIIDYAHTPDALENLLTGVDTAGRKIIVFGCGGDRDRTKRSIMGQVATKYADQVFVTSDNPRTENPRRIINDILEGIPSGISPEVIEKRDEAIVQALNFAGPGDLVIIAGKGHEDYQVIGNTRHFFSDPKVVLNHLKKLGYAGS
jgi:UDP-N-acetylmuramoyl-L-alanyl-D-glutamate--2,6-diaminopimelate ligase